MKNQTFVFVFAFMSTLFMTFSGCAVVGGIFKAGVAVGVFIVVIVVALIIYLMSKISKK